MRTLSRKEENKRRIGHFAPVLTVGIVGVAVSIFIWYLTATSENRTFVQVFDGRANNQAIILQNGIDDYWDKLYAVRALFDSSNNAITREEFESFSNSLLAGRAAILNISWMPRIRREERVAHELAAVRDGLTDYHIRAIAREGSLPVSPERDEYFPKYYSTEVRTSRVYGLDLNDGGIRERVLNHIRDANVLSTSPPLLLHIGQGDRRGFWAGVPVYARGLPHETTEDRRRNLLGIVQGVFQIGVMIDGIFAGVKTPVELYLFAPNAAADDLPVYFKSHLDAESIVARSQATLGVGLHRSFPIKFGDVQWQMVVVPEQTSLMSSGQESSSILLIFGLLLSGGLTFFIWAMRRSADKLTTVNDTLEVTNDKFERNNLQLDAALANMSQGLLMFDSAGKLVISNRHFAELFEVPWEKWEIPSLGMTIPQAMQFRHDLNKNVTEKNTGEILAAIKRTLDTRARGNVVVERTDGRTFGLSLAPTTNGGFVATFEDITERRRTEDQIAHMAHYDALTDLPNRTLFYERMKELLTGAQQSGTFAVLSLDLDHFKSVNDTLGHPIGDKLLQAVAVRMRSCIRENDIVARLGGDEFAILQDTLNKPADATLLATRLTDAVSEPYQIDGHQVIVGASIGIAIAPRDGSEPDQLMKNADLALYRCKAEGGCKYQFYEAKMDRRIGEHHALELDLRKALVNGEFTLNYQPIVNLKTGKVTACEALIRWHHPERGCVLPLEFIPIAEETGLIVPIGEWVLGRACADAADWPDDISVAVNVSPVQFRIADFVQNVTSALEKSRLPASRLELEITEFVLIQDDDAAFALLHQLKDLGVSIAMDDFGTGHSSLGYLRRFPFDRIKIDQSFIRDLPNSKDSLAIIRAVVGLGRSLGIVTTAEGVETQIQLEILRTEGCTEVQGFFFSPPKSAEETRTLLTSLDSQPKAVA